MEDGWVAFKYLAGGELKSCPVLDNTRLVSPSFGVDTGLHRSVSNANCTAGVCCDVPIRDTTTTPLLLAPCWLLASCMSRPLCCQGTFSGRVRPFSPLGFDTSCFPLL